MRLTNTHINKGFKLADQAMVSGTNFIVGILMVRSLGLEEYGVFTFFWMVVLLAASLHQGIISQPMFSIGPTIEKAQKRGYHGSLAVFHILFLLLTLIFSAIIFAIVPESMIPVSRGSLSMVFLLIPAYLTFDYQRKVYLYQNKSVQSATLAVLMMAVQLGGTVYAMIHALPFQFYIFVMVASYVPAVIPVLVSLSSIKTLTKYLRQHWHFGKWMLATAIFQYSSGNLYLVAGAAVLGPAALGLIRTIQNALGTLTILFQVLENHVPASAAAILYRDGEKALQKYLATVTKKGLLIVGLICIAFVALSGWLLDTFYNVDDLRVLPLSALMAIVYLLVFINNLHRLYFRTMLETRQIFISYVLAAVISLIVLKLLLNSVGFWGIPAGLILSQLISLGWFLFILNRRKNYENYTYHLRES